MHRPAEALRHRIMGCTGLLAALTLGVAASLAVAEAGGGQTTDTQTTTTDTSDTTTTDTETTTTGAETTTTGTQTAAALPGERSQDFSSNPDWDAAHNHSSLNCTPRYQNFGFSPNTKYASGRSGEIGGTFKRSLRLASYAKDTGSHDLSQPLRASGMLSLPANSSATPQRDGADVVIGWFNSQDSHFWRLSNSIVFRLDGLTNGRVLASATYGTDNWLSHQERYEDMKASQTLALGKRYNWSLEYDPPPKGQGWGVVRLKIGSWNSLRVPLTEQAYKDGALFDRFGMMNQTIGTGGDRLAGTMTAFVDDLSLDGVSQGFTSTDPNWQGDGNHVDGGDDCDSVRPRQDFGYDDRTPAGDGGGIGGRMWRTELDDPNGIAYYADRIDDLDLSQPLHAHGHLVQKEGYVDSGLFMGWFHSQDSTEDADHHQPKNFLGVGFGGLSDLGYWVGPTWRSDGDVEDRLDQHLLPPDGPFPIYPNGDKHEFDLSYEPGDCSTGDKGKISMTLDGKDTGTLKIDPCLKAHFNRFGLRVATPGGQSQLVYFDDLTYTASSGVTTQSETTTTDTTTGTTPTDTTTTDTTPTDTTTTDTTTTTETQGTETQPTDTGTTTSDGGQTQISSSSSTSSSDDEEKTDEQSVDSGSDSNGERPTSRKARPAF